MKLIDLLLTLDFEWPEGVEYVAQDMGVSSRGTIWFYTSLPELGERVWWVYSGRVVGRLRGHTLCSDWNTSVVSKEEYFAKLNQHSPIEDLIYEIELQQQLSQTSKLLLLSTNVLRKKLKLSWTRFWERLS